MPAAATRTSGASAHPSQSQSPPALVPTRKSPRLRRRRRQEDDELITNTDTTAIASTIITADPQKKSSEETNVLLHVHAPQEAAGVVVVQPPSPTTTTSTMTTTEDPTTGTAAWTSIRAQMCTQLDWASAWTHRIRPSVVSPAATDGVVTDDDKDGEGEAEKTTQATSRAANANETSTSTALNAVMIPPDDDIFNTSSSKSLPLISNIDDDAYNNSCSSSSSLHAAEWKTLWMALRQASRHERDYQGRETLRCQEQLAERDAHLHQLQVDMADLETRRDSLSARLQQELHPQTASLANRLTLQSLELQQTHDATRALWQKQSIAMTHLQHTISLYANCVGIKWLDDDVDDDDSSSSSSNNNKNNTEGGESEYSRSEIDNDENQEPTKAGTTKMTGSTHLKQGTMRLRGVVPIPSMHGLRKIDLLISDSNRYETANLIWRIMTDGALDETNLDE